MTNSIALILEPEQLATLQSKADTSSSTPQNANEATNDLLIIDLCSPETYAQAHIEGAVYINPAEIVSGIQPAVGKLPTIDRLQALFDRIGYSPDKHIVAYDDEGGGWAGRFIWTLDMIGHKASSYLNGGLHAWLAAELPVTSEPTTPIPSQHEITLSGDRNASMGDVLASLEDDNIQIWDARSPAEHRGDRSGSKRAGCIPDAINFDWLEAMDRDHQLRIRPDIKELLIKRGFDLNKTLYTHCQTHHRSGLTYLIGKSLGIDIKAYDGSWSEWGNQPDTPVEVG